MNILRKSFLPAIVSLCFSILLVGGSIFYKVFYTPGDSHAVVYAEGTITLPESEFDFGFFGEYVAIPDGTTTTKFWFGNLGGGNSGLCADATGLSMWGVYQNDCSTGNVFIDIGGGADIDAIGAALADAINTSSANSAYTISAAYAGGRLLNVSNTNPGVGAEPITETVVAAGFSVTGMTLPGNAPSLSNLVANQRTDGTGSVDINVQIVDNENDLSSIKVEYKEGDCSENIFAIATVSSTFTATNTTGISVSTTGPTYNYQFINTDVTNTIGIVWESDSDLPSGNGTYCLGLTPSDTSDGTQVTTTLTIDNVDPTAPGPLTTSTLPGPTSTVAWLAGPSTETNFSQYRIYFATGTTAPDPINDPSGATRVSTIDTNLDAINFNFAFETLVDGFLPGNTYAMNIFAYDLFGNATSAPATGSNLKIVVTPALPDVTSWTVANGSTDFSVLGDLYSVSRVTLANANGSILWLNNVTSTGQNYDSGVYVGSEFVSVSTSLLHSSHDALAYVSLETSSCDSYSIYSRAGFWTSKASILTGNTTCNADTSPACTEITCNEGVVRFYVADFDYSYAINQNVAAAAPVVQGDVGSAGSISAPVSRSPVNSNGEQVNDINIDNQESLKNEVEQVKEEEKLPEGPLVEVNNGISISKSNTVDVKVLALEFFDTVILSNDSKFVNSKTFNVSDNISWELESGYGKKTLYIKLIGKNNTANRVIDITVEPNSENLFLINSGAKVTKSRYVLIKFLDSSFERVNIRNSLDSSFKTYTIEDGSIVWDLGESTGTKLIDFEFLTEDKTSVKVRGGILYNPSLDKLFSINGGASETVRRDVVLNIYDTSFSSLEISNDSKFLNSVRLNVGQKHNWQLSPGAGQKTVYVRFREENGEEIVASSKINYIAQSGSFFSINGGAMSTKSREVNIQVNEDIYESIFISNNQDFSDRKVFPYSESIIWTLTEGSGIKTVYVGATGQNGLGRAGSESITLTSEALPSFEINGGAEVTKDQNVILYFNTEDSDTIQISNNPLFADAQTYSYADSLIWKLGPGIGIKSVYARIIQEDGNVIEVSDSINHLPNLENILQINGGAKETTDRNVVLNIESEGFEQIQISNDFDFENNDIIPVSSVMNFELLPGLGDKSVYVRLIDENGETIETSKSIKLISNEDEEQKYFLINGGSEETLSREVIITSDNKEFINIEISNLADLSDAEIIQNSGSVQWSLTEGFGVKKVYVRLYREDGSSLSGSNVIKYVEKSSQKLDENVDKEQNLVQEADLRVNGIDESYIRGEGPFCWLVEKYAYRAINSNVIYYVNNACTKSLFRTEEKFFTYFNDFGEVKIVNQSDLDKIDDDPLGFLPYGPLYKPLKGALLKTVFNPQVYLYSPGSKFPIASEKALRALGYFTEQIKDIVPEFLEGLTTGQVITDQ